MKVALVHDWLNQWGGAERVLETLHEIFPEAPIYTSLYNPEALPSYYRSWDIRTSFMQQLPWAQRHHQRFLPLYPLAFRSFNLSRYDVVISNSSGFGHGVATPSHTCHINYCLTPPRFLWNLPGYLERERIHELLLLALPPLISYLRQWDAASSRNVDQFVAISRAVQERIKACYGRDSAVIHPPVDTSHFAIEKEQGDYFLVVSRLIPYKRIDLAVQAFNDLGLPLWIAGEGRDRIALQSMAGPNIRFLGAVAEEEVPRLVAGCRAFIFPGEEDFGIAPVEAMAAGRPVIAYGKGGSLDTVVDGVSGLLFVEPTAEALAEAVSRFRDADFDPHPIRQHARSFDTRVFKDKMVRFVAEKAKEHGVGAEGH